MDAIDEAMEREWKMRELLGQGQRGTRLHTCSICGKTDIWGPSWSWFGSLMDLDNGEIVKFCGPECFSRRHQR
jgi:hypothetical protein